MKKTSSARPGRVGKKWGSDDLEPESEFILLLIIHILIIILLLYKIEIYGSNEFEMNQINIKALQF